MHDTHISRYERDLTQPSLDVIKKLAEALKVSADDLIFGNTEQQLKNSIQDKELLKMFNRVQSLDKADVDTIKNMINAYILKSDLQQKLVY